MSVYIVSTDCINTIATAFRMKSIIPASTNTCANWMMADNVLAFNSRYKVTEPTAVDFYQPVDTDFNDIQQVGTLVSYINEYSYQCSDLPDWETSVLKSKLDNLLEICMTATTPDNTMSAAHVWSKESGPFPQVVTAWVPAARIWPKESEPVLVAPTLSATVAYVCSVDMLTDHHNRDRECLIRGGISEFGTPDDEALDNLRDSLQQSIAELDDCQLPFDTDVAMQVVEPTVRDRFAGSEYLLLPPDAGEDYSETAVWVLLTW